MDSQRVIVGGVGYPDLRDHSVGVVAIERLLETWPLGAAIPAGVVVEDLSYNPIAVVQRLQAEPVGACFCRAILIAGFPRPGRPPGTIDAYRWDGVLPSPELVQEAVAEAVTGVISLDNTLVITRQFGALPDEVVVVEVEPAIEEFGVGFSPIVAEAFERACELVANLAIDPVAARSLPRTPLGGARYAPEVR